LYRLEKQVGALTSCIRKQLDHPSYKVYVGSILLKARFKQGKKIVAISHSAEGKQCFETAAGFCKGLACFCLCFLVKKGAYLLIYINDVFRCQLAFLEKTRCILHVQYQNVLVRVLLSEFHHILQRCEDFRVIFFEIRDHVVCLESICAQPCFYSRELLNPDIVHENQGVNQFFSANVIFCLVYKEF